MVLVSFFLGLRNFPGGTTRTVLWGQALLSGGVLQLGQGHNRPLRVGHLALGLS